MQNNLDQAMLDAGIKFDDEAEEEIGFLKEQNLEVDILQQTGKNKDNDKKFSKFTKPDI